MAAIILFCAIGSLQIASHSLIIKYSFATCLRKKMKKRMIILLLTAIIPQFFINSSPPANDWFSHWSPKQSLKNLHRIRKYLPESFNVLQEKTESLANILCFPLALSHKNGPAEFWVCHGNVGASSLYQPDIFNNHIENHGWNLSEEPVQVSCITLDEWAQQNNVSHIDFMWLDMEGAELAMLAASKEIFKTVRAIWMEVSTVHLREDVPLYPEIKSFMLGKGFEEKIVINKHQQKDILFVRH